MAKQTASSEQPIAPPPLWNSDDLQRLSEQIDSLASRNESMSGLLVGVVERLNKVEADLALVDVDRATLPIELTKSVNLGQIYNSAICSALQTKLLMNPKLVDDIKFLPQALDNVLRLADALVTAVCNRHGVDAKAKVG